MEDDDFYGYDLEHDDTASEEELTADIGPL